MLMYEHKLRVQLPVKWYESAVHYFFSANYYCHNNEELDKIRIAHSRFEPTGAKDELEKQMHSNRSSNARLVRDQNFRSTTKQIKRSSATKAKRQKQSQKNVQSMKEPLGLCDWLLVLSSLPTRILRDFRVLSPRESGLSSSTPEKDETSETGRSALPFQNCFAIENVISGVVIPFFDCTVETFWMAN